MDYVDGVDFSVWPTMAASCVFFTVLYYIAPYILRKFVDNYDNHTEKIQVELRQMLTSTLHAFVTSSGCVYVMLTDENIHDDPTWGDNYIVRNNCAFVAGYMISDMILMTINYESTGSIYYYLHHIASVAAYLYSFSYHIYEYFSNFRIIAEFSTPNVNLRRFLEIQKYDKTKKLYIINGVVLAIVFFLVRVAVIPFYWSTIYHMLMEYQGPSLGISKHVLVWCSFALDSINVFWMWKIIRGAVKTVKQIPSKKAQ